VKALFFLNEDIRKYEKIIIYGAGMAGKNTLFKLLQQNVKPWRFAESDPERCGTRFMNIPVAHIDELASERGSAAVIVSGQYAFELGPKLKKRGFTHLFFDYGNEFGLIHLERDEE
jgi:FlaA1/EpsC-like NDP-sugar epimerase